MPYIIKMVPTPGVEPGRAFARRILSPLRLPIPPGGQRFHPGRLGQPELRWRRREALAPARPSGRTDGLCRADL